MWHDKFIHLFNLYLNRDTEHFYLPRKFPVHTVTWTSDLIFILTHYVQEFIVTEMVLNCISLMTNDAEYLFMCLLVICISSSGKYGCVFSPYFKWVVFIFFNSGYKSFDRIFSPVCGLQFIFLTKSVEEQEGCDFDEIQFINFPFLKFLLSAS